jgi:hypothetical protein
MKLGELLMKVPNRRIGRFFGHLPALPGPLNVERAIVFRAHGDVLIAAGSDPPSSRRDAAPAPSIAASSYYNSMDNQRR